MGCGLDYTLTMAFALGPARLVSTPSGFPAWLGIASERVPPNLSSSTPPVSQEALNF